MVGGGKRELRRQATNIWIKEATGRRSTKRKQDIKIFSLALSCYNFASWWYPPSAINPVYLLTKSHELTAMPLGAAKASVTQSSALEPYCAGTVALR
jgi:hypothetical protein